MMEIVKILDTFCGAGGATGFRRALAPTVGGNCSAGNGAGRGVSGKQYAFADRGRERGAVKMSDEKHPSGWYESDDVGWIAGLMRENYEAVGFIPYRGIEKYIHTGRYILQSNEVGKSVGYLLHGKLSPGGIVVVSQHCIDMDKRMKGYGEKAFLTLLERARVNNCRAIKVRCAADLPSNDFWLEMGLKVTRVMNPNNQRHRQINVMVLDLYPSLWDVMEYSVGEE